MKTEKLETLGLLASGIAHDFNNLLVSILGNADVALYKLSSDSPVYHCIENIKKASLKASGLTNQMLAYSGKENLFVEPVDINMLIDEMAQILKISISNNITLKFNFAENLPPIEADATQIHQILMNLIINASEAIGEHDGCITIKTGISEKGSEKTSKNNPLVFIEISDTGPGMDEKTKSRIFDPLYTTKPKGRGLGLSIVQENILGHNGSIDVSSKSGQGTVFTVCFPASDKTIKKEEPEIESITIKDGTILVIDDDRDVLEVVRSMLETAGINVCTFSSGHKGLRFLKNNIEKVDIILLDVTMPNMSGEEVFRKIRKIHRDIPVILSSGYGKFDIKQHFTEFCESDFIRKPYQLKTIIRKINSKLKHN
ncbi:response regulator [Candidatus Latescibacterota bacterium]